MPVPPTSSLSRLMIASLNTQLSTLNRLNVWDGDWAILEEYTTGNVLVEKYVQGYHGLVKTLVDNISYYQDELGSTSHIASASGALIESYQYDVYGKPRVYDSGGNFQPGATPLAKDLFTGQRWHSELGLYDDRNRFMSPDLGRFLQPDPIGFKGDASNLYRYCGNDWANRSDPMGLEATPNGSSSQATDLTGKELQNAIARGDLSESGSLMWDFEKRADTSGGNGSRDGRAARPDASSADAPKAIASGQRFAQNGNGVNMAFLPGNFSPISPVSREVHIEGVKTFANLADPRNQSLAAQVFQTLIGIGVPGGQFAALAKAGQIMRLSKGEIKLLERAGHDIHELKGGRGASKLDLFKDKKGNIDVRPKSGKGPGDPTGLNINQIRQQLSGLEEI